LKCAGHWNSKKSSQDGKCERSQKQLNDQSKLIGGIFRTKQ
jgi:hypothetical protein